jgi:hypothetical protein
MNPQSRDETKPGLPHLSQDECRSGKLLLTRIGAMFSKLCLKGVAWRVTTLFRVRLRA